jgi:Leishmanolysin
MLKVKCVPSAGVGSRCVELGIQGTGVGCPYIGGNASREFKAISGCTSVPVEQQGAQGTFCSHWDDRCLDRELMTGFANPGVSNPLSRITIGSLDDMGYAVDYTRADPYGAANVNISCLCGRHRRRLGLQSDSLPDSPPMKSDTLRNLALNGTARQKAIEYGQEILAEKAKSSSSRSGNSEWTYIGDQQVIVLYHDGNGIQDVVVNKKSST